MDTLLLPAESPRLVPLIDAVWTEQLPNALDVRCMVLRVLNEQGSSLVCIAACFCQQTLYSTRLFALLMLILYLYMLILYRHHPPPSPLHRRIVNLTGCPAWCPSPALLAQ